MSSKHLLGTDNSNQFSGPKVPPGLQVETGRETQLRHWRYVVALDKVTKQLQGLMLYMQAQRVDYYGTFPVQTRDPVQKELIRQLEIQVAKQELALTELQKWKVQGLVRTPTLWDSIMVSVYNWAKG